MSESSKAVFLSYAHEDSDVARAIAEALRAEGIAVWFDESALRGGDAWDASIRRQIRDCALFVPIISARTQARKEGYFRLEWKLADERSHLIAEGEPFVLPVVADGTKERDALVPKSFLNVQWTWLPRGEVPAALMAHMRALLRQDAARDTIGSAASVADSARPTIKSRTPMWPWIALTGAAAAAIVVFFTTRRSEAPSAPPAKARADAKSSVAALPSDKSIAVLPFGNLSPDKENEYFADGIHEDLLTNLQNIRELRVVSRTSVLGYRGTTKKIQIPEIARDLGVAYVVEGSVRRAGDRVRISVQLIDARTDAHVWSPQPYDRKLNDVFAIQTEIAQAIAAALKAALSPQEKTLIETPPTTNPAAYDLYLKAGDIGRTQADTLETRKARESLLQAVVTLDPKFAEAWANLGSFRAYDRLVGRDRTEARLAQATEAIERAQRLAPDSPTVIHNVGLYYYFAFRDYARAEEAYQRGMRLQPNNASPIYALGALYRRTGRWAEAVAFMRRSLELDSGWTFAREQLAQLLTAGRHYEEALAERRRLAAQFPEDLGRAYQVTLLKFQATGSPKEVEAFFAGLAPTEATGLRKQWAVRRGNLAEYLRLEPTKSRGLTQAVVLAAQGNLLAARARVADPAPLRKRLEVEPENFQVWSNLGAIEALSGDADEALRCARKAVELLPESVDQAVEGRRAAVNLAFVYSWTGDKDRAIAEYARLLRLPFSGLNVHEMKTDPQFHPLRGDPRFEALLNDPKNNAPLF